jgi:hypothetical protein
VTWPDASVAVAPVKAQETVEVPTAAPANSVSDNAERTAQRADPTNNPGMPIIIFPVLALGLVGVGIVIKNAAARRSRIIIDQAEPDTVDDQRQHEWRDEQYLDESLVDGQELGSLVSAVSEPGPLRDEAGAFQIAQENSERRDKLLQFCRDIDRMLQPPTSAQKEPLRRRTAAWRQTAAGLQLRLFTRLLAKSLKESFQRLRNHIIWLFTRPPIEARIHAKLEDFGIHGFVKEACRNSQRADLISRGQCLANLLRFGFHRYLLRLQPMI